MVQSSKDVILVTGGTGLVGKGIEHISKQDQKPNEEFVFLSSKDGNLMYANFFHFLFCLSIYLGSPPAFQMFV